MRVKVRLSFSLLLSLPSFFPLLSLSYLSLSFSFFPFSASSLFSSYSQYSLSLSPLSHFSAPNEDISGRHLILAQEDLVSGFEMEAVVAVGVYAE